MSESSNQRSAPPANNPAVPTAAAAPPPSVPRDSFQRVRFSAEDGRLGGDDASAPGALVGGAGGDAGSRGSLEAVAAPPLAAARRHRRGRSLRHQLFPRRTQDGFQDGGKSEGLLGRRHCVQSASSDSVELERLGGDSPASSKSKNLAAASDCRALIRNPLLHHRQRRTTFGWLHRRFAPAWRRLAAFGADLKKTILRTHKLPPSSEGRRIPLHVRRTALLIDERTGNHYVNNTVRRPPPFGLEFEKPDC